LKVTHVNTLLGGGAARAVERLHDGLLQLGCTSLVYTLAEGRAEYGNVFRFRASRSLLSRIKGRMRGNEIERAFAAYRGGRPEGLELFSDDRSVYCHDVVQQMPPCDVVNLHWISGFIDYTTFFSAVRKPVVWTMHDMHAFTGGCHYNLQCERFREACGACPQLGSSQADDLSHGVWKRKRDALSSAAPGMLHVVATSQWMRRQVEESSLFADVPVSLIPLGLDTESFSPRDGQGMRSALGIPDNVQVILFAADSVTNRRKGFDELVQALNSLNGKDKVFLLTIGGGTPVLDGGIRHLHVGHLKNDRIMSAIYSAADIFVIPSLQEAFGQTALEAMACGTPVVGFDAGGIPDMVRPGVTGLLAPAGDVVALRECIERVLREPGERRFMAMQCRQVVENEFGLRLQAERYLDLYKSMLSG